LRFSLTRSCRSSLPKSLAPPFLSWQHRHGHQAPPHCGQLTPYTSCLLVCSFDFLVMTWCLSTTLFYQPCARAAGNATSPPARPPLVHPCTWPGNLRPPLAMPGLVTGAT
jgi:hypothetical protein